MKNKLEKIFKISGLVMIVFSLGMILYRLIESIVYQVNGWYLSAPGPALTKWNEIFVEKLLVYTFYVFPILLVGIILLASSFSKR